MNITKENVIGQLVAKDYRTAAVFKTHNIDFCCKGNRSITDVCEEDQLETDTLIYELNQAIAKSASSKIDYEAWDMDLLADYIEKKHHRYVQKQIPEIKAYLEKTAKVYGSRHPELLEIEQLFSDSSEELIEHMKKEETILFPYVREIMEDQTSPQSNFKSVENPIQEMMQEHDNEGERFRKIAALTNNYVPPEDACSTYKVAFSLLKEFEEDLHLHIHLENNILFPSAMETEKNLKFA